MKREAILAFLLVSVILSSTGVVSAQPAQKQKYVAFRDDDVAPFSSIDTLKTVDQVHIDENVPVTLGIVPHPWIFPFRWHSSNGSEGNELLEDSQFLSYMRSIAENHLFEFAQHGYSHVDDRLSPNGSEFAGRPYDVQFELLQKGQADIKEAFGVTPTTFIPPFDKGDNGTLQAIAALGFTTYSTNFSDFLVQERFEHVTVEAALPIGGASDAAFSASILAAINATERFLNAPNSGDTLTVAYHWWQFNADNGTVDARKIELFRDYIDYLKTRGVLFTRLDRSQGEGNVVLTGPSAVAGLSVRTAGQNSTLVFILVGSVVIVLFAVYAIALRRRLRSTGAITERDARR